MSHNPLHPYNPLENVVTLKPKFNQFWDEQAEWSEKTFGSSTERGPLGPLKHLEKEAKEAQAEANMLLGFIEAKQQENTKDYDTDIRVGTASLKEEIADCLFLTIDAARRSGMTPEDLLSVAFAKLEKNKKRTWQKPTTDGPVEHVRD